MRLHLLLVFLPVALAFGDSSYRPLSGKDIRRFKESLNAVELAHNEGNHEAVILFAPKMLEEFASVNLDPNTKELRSGYKSIQAFLEAARAGAVMDSARQAVEETIQAKNALGCMEAYQPYLALLQKTGQDSLRREHLARFSQCQKAYFRQNPNHEALTRVGKFAYYDLPEWIRFSKGFQDEIRDAFVRASMTMDRDSLIVFSKKYPGIYQEEVQTLLEKARVKAYLATLRHPSKSGILAYYRQYPTRNAKLEGAMEDLLIRDFRRYASLDAAQEYLNNFPEGRFVGEVQEFKDRQAISIADSLRMAAPAGLR